MATVEVNPRYGRVEKGDRIPYGTLAGADWSLRRAYYYEGYPKDSDFPELPVWEPEVVEVDLERTVLRAQTARIVAEMLDTLTPREAKVLRLRFGVELTHDRTLEEVGVLFGVTRERIRQIEAKAMRKLKKPQRYDVLKHCLSPNRRW